MKAVITVIGKDKVGIIAEVSGFLAKKSVNILDISQTIMQDMFCMIMLVEFRDDDTVISDISGQLTELGKRMGLSIHLQREELFQSMHRI
ncbi:MAG: ACT domain-containing protein [Clostridia bacterium]|nr:ACT domain-containing protein [Clostridia bacterium]